MLFSDLVGTFQSSETGEHDEGGKGLRGKPILLFYAHCWNVPTNSEI